MRKRQGRSEEETGRDRAEVRKRQEETGQK